MWSRNINPLPQETSSDQPHSKCQLDNGSDESKLSNAAYDEHTKPANTIQFPFHPATSGLLFLGSDDHKRGELAGQTDLPGQLRLATIDSTGRISFDLDSGPARITLYPPSPSAASSIPLAPARATEQQSGFGDPNAVFPVIPDDTRGNLLNEESIVPVKHDDPNIDKENESNGFVPSEFYQKSGKKEAKSPAGDRTENDKQDFKPPSLSGDQLTKKSESETKDSESGESKTSQPANTDSTISEPNDSQLLRNDNAKEEQTVEAPATAAKTAAGSTTKESETRQVVSDPGKQTSQSTWRLPDWVEPWMWWFLLISMALVCMLLLFRQRQRRKKNKVRHHAARPAATGENTSVNFRSHAQALRTAADPSRSADEDFGYIERDHDALANQSTDDIETPEAPSEFDDEFDVDEIAVLKDDESSADHDEYARQFAMDFADQPSTSTEAGKVRLQNAAEPIKFPSPAEPALKLAEHPQLQKSGPSPHEQNGPATEFAGSESMRNHLSDSTPDRSSSVADATNIDIDDNDGQSNVSAEPTSGTASPVRRYALADNPFNPEEIVQNLTEARNNGDVAETSQSDSSAMIESDQPSATDQPDSMYAELQSELNQVRELLELAQREREEVNERFHAIRIEAEEKDRAAQVLAEELSGEKERVQKFSAQIDEFDATRRSLESEREQLKAEVKSLEQQAIEVRAELERKLAEEKEAKIDDFQSTLASLEGSLQESAELREQTESQFADQANEMAAMIARLGSVEGEKENLAAKVETYESELVNARKQIAETQSRLAETVANLETKEQELAETGQELADAAKRTEGIQAIAGSTSAEVETLKQKHSTLQEQIAALNKQVEQEKEKRNELVSVKTGHESSIASLTNQIATAHLERDQSKQKLEELSSQIESLHAEREQMAELAKSAESKTEELLRLEESIATADTEKERLTTELSVLHEQQKLHESELEQLRGETASRDKKLESLRNELSASHHKIEKQESELADARQLIQTRAEAEASQVDADSRIAALEKALHESDEKSGELQSEINRLTSLQSEQALRLFEQNQADEALRKKDSEAAAALQKELERTIEQLAQQQKKAEAQEKGTLSLRKSLSERAAKSEPELESQADESKESSQGKQQLENQLAYARRDHEIAISERNRLMKELAAEQESKLHLNSDLESANAASELLACDNAQLQQKLRDAEKQQARLKRELEKLQSRVKPEPPTAGSQTVSKIESRLQSPDSTTGATKIERNKTGDKLQASVSRSNSVSDDLTRLPNVGPAMQTKLNQHGLNSFEKIKNLDENEVRNLIENVSGLTAERLKQIIDSAKKLQSDAD